MTLIKNNFIDAKINFLNRNIFVVGLLWVGLASITSALEIFRGSINNYDIYQNVFWNTIHQRNLYLPYPNLYFDTNHYGPFFSIIILPFALIPKTIGCFLWCLLNAGFLLFAVRQLPLSITAKNFILWIALIENLTSIHNVEINPMIVAWMILSYTAIMKGKIGLGTFFIWAGTFIKLYSIVGLLFFLFTPLKRKFILYCLFWVVLLFCLPMLLSSPDFIIQSYKHWIQSLLEKDSANNTSLMQNISIMGFFKNITGNFSIPNLYFLLPAILFSLTPLLRFQYWKNDRFQLHYLAQMMIGVVVFSSSAESPTYIIAVVGFALWYVTYDFPRPTWAKLLFILLFIFTILSPTELFPSNFRNLYVKQYKLKAIFPFITWILLTFELNFKLYQQSFYAAKKG